MRHRRAGKKLNRSSSHRKAMFRNMITSLLRNDRIQTTDAKAKVLRTWADHLVTLAKRGDLHARRQALSIVREKDVVHKLFDEAPERFGHLSGGYTRLVKVGLRAGDAAPISIVELITSEKVKEKKKSRKKKAKKKEETAPAAPVKAETEKGTEAEPPAPATEASGQTPETAHAGEVQPPPEPAAGQKPQETAPPPEAPEEPDAPEAAAGDGALETPAEAEKPQPQ